MSTGNRNVLEMSCDMSIQNVSELLRDLRRKFLLEITEICMK